MTLKFVVMDEDSGLTLHVGEIREISSFKLADGRRSYSICGYGHAVAAKPKYLPGNAEMKFMAFEGPGDALQILEPTQRGPWKRHNDGVRWYPDIDPDNRLANADWVAAVDKSRLPATSCRCEMRDLMSTGHVPGCPEKK